MLEERAACRTWLRVEATLWFLAASGTAAALELPPRDCAALRASVLAEPEWYARDCGTARLKADPGIAADAPGGATVDVAYMLNLRAAAPNAQNLLTFTLPNASAPVLVGPQARSLYALDFDDTTHVLWAIDDATRELGPLSTTTGAFTPSVVVTGIPAGQTITGLTIEPGRGTFYMSTSTGAASSLYVLDSVTGAATLRGAITGFPSIVDVAVDCDGKLFGHDVSLDQILEIDPLTGAPTLVGLTGFDASFAQGMDFNHADGLLYAWIHTTGGASVLALIDLDTGAATTVSTPPAGQYEGAIPNCCFSPKGNFNIDKSVDLLFRNTTSNRMVVWLMDGVDRLSGSFVTPDPPADWRAVGTDDFDDETSPGSGPDGYHTDLVMRNFATGALEFWLMDGLGRVGPPVPVTGAAPLPLDWELEATGDYDLDENPDLVWRHTVTGQIRIWLMDATAKVGERTPTPDHAADANWRIVGGLDFDRDGLRDLLWYNSTSGKVVLWLLDASQVRSTGFFTTPPAAADANWSVVAGGDFGEGPSVDATARACSADIVWRNRDSGSIVVWRMDFDGKRTSGTFTNPPAPLSDRIRWVPAGPR